MGDFGGGLFVGCGANEVVVGAADFAVFDGNHRHHHITRFDCVYDGDGFVAACVAGVVGQGGKPFGAVFGRGGGRRVAVSICAGTFVAPV